MSEVWNEGKLPTCHCSDCDAKAEPPCSLCGEDCIPLDEQGHCAKCAKDLEEVES